MYIREIHIEGFGIFRDASITGLSSGLNLFTGDNESGKTTLMEFVRFILFGSKGANRDYKPAQSGIHGGKMLIVTLNDLNLVVGRTGKKASLTSQRGGSSPFGSIEELLAGIDRSTFENVFAVGLQDLQGLGVISSEGSGGWLLAAGKGQGSAPLPEVIKKIEAEKSNLLNSSLTGKKIINQLLSEIKDKTSLIQKLQDQSQEYASLQSQKSRLAEKILTDENRLSKINRRLNRIDQLSRAREKWLHLCTCEDHLRRLDFAKDFPGEGLNQFERLKTDLAALQSSREEKEILLREHESQYSRIAINEAYLLQQAAIEGLVSEISHLESAVQDLPDKTIKKHQAEDVFRKRLAELGTGWDSARLAGVDTSVQVRQHVQETGRQLEFSERQLESDHDHVRAAQGLVEDARQALETARENLAKVEGILEVDLPKIQKQQEALYTLSSLVHKRDIELGQLAAVEARQKDLLQQPGNNHPLPLWLVPVPLGLGLVSSVWLALQNWVPAAAIAFLCGAGLSWILYIVRRRDSIPAAWGQNQKLLAREIERLKEESRIKQQSIEQIAAAVGLEIPQDMDHVQQMITQLGKTAERLNQQARLSEVVRSCELQLKRQAEKLGRAEQDLADSAEKVRQLNSDWQAWLHQRGFDVKVRPDGFDTILQIIESARTAEINVTEFNQRLNEMMRYIDSVCQRILAVLAACGEIPAARDIGVEDIRKLKRSLDSVLAAHRQKRDLQEKIDLARNEVDSWGRKIASVQSEIIDLFAKSGCRNEAEFLAKGASFAELESYRRQYEEDNLALQVIAGSREAQLALQKELSETEVIQLKEEEKALQQEADEVSKVIAQNHEEIGSLNVRIEQMEMDKDLGRLLLARSSLEEQLRQNLKRWASLVVCGSLLESTLKIYERDRQPEFIKEADRLLDIITGSRYHLFSPAGGSDIQLEDRSLARKNETAWSTGLAEQVYLAIRLSMAQVYSRNMEPIPVILDDILVNFDPGRQLGAARVILEFARRQQVLLFSCHPETRDIFNSAARDLGIADGILKNYTVADGTIRDI